MPNVENTQKKKEFIKSQHQPLTELVIMLVLEVMEELIMLPKLPVL